jgi:hypothetical protein
MGYGGGALFDFVITSDVSVCGIIFPVLQMGHFSGSTPVSK